MNLRQKSTVAEIRARFDQDVDRFSNLETGQVAMPDSLLFLELTARAAAAVTPRARAVLDLGCGAGNYTLKLLQHLPGLDCTLVDLSQPMLARARERVSAATRGRVETRQCDIRELRWPAASYDLILAAAVLHHLRGEEEWNAVLAAVASWLRPGGSFWIVDKFEASTLAVEQLLQDRYSHHLIQVGGGAAAGAAYRDHVFSYIEKEDSPRPLLWFMRRMEQAGFQDLDILHKNGPFTALGGCKK